MLLYQFAKGTNPRRVIIYLQEKGLEVPRKELDYSGLEHRGESYLRLNPSGRAPILVTDTGQTITDSGAIVEYLEELYPEPSMIGTDPVTRARVRAMERLATDLVVRFQLWLWNLTDTFPAKEPRPSRDVADRLYRYVLEVLDALEGAIGESRFLVGGTPTIADCTLFAVFQTARERFNLPLGSGHQRLDRWYGHFCTRPSARY